MSQKTKTCLIAFATILLIFVALGGGSQSFAKEGTYPSKEISVYIGFAPGGSVDLGGRVICKAMEKILGKPLVPINVRGASSGIAVSRVAESKPDGYTLNYGLFPYPIQKKIEEPSMPYGVDKLTFLGSNHNCYDFLVVRANSPWKTFDDFVKSAKEKPIKFASIGSVSLQSSEQLLLSKAVGFKKLIQVPYAGGNPAAMALMRGDVDAFTSCGAVMPYIRSKDLKFLVYLASKRNPQFPDVPAITEKNKNYKLFLSATDYLAAPKGIPRPLMDKLTKTFTKAIESEAVKNYFKKIAYVSAYRTPEKIIELWKQEKAFYTERFKEVKAKGNKK
jgi:tripartite-type tricarboxylate transporter receptor subunit TctC